jgi:hypothetical protein
VSQEWPGGWVTGMRVQAQQAKYRAPDPFFGLARKDTEGRVELDVLNRKIRWWGFSPQRMFGYVSANPIWKSIATPALAVASVCYLFSASGADFSA